MGSWPSDLCGSRVSYGGLPTSLSRFPVFLEVQRPLSYFFEDFGLHFLGFFSRFLSSLLRYTQPYGRATITFSFRQFSLFSLHQSYWSIMMQSTLSLSLSTVQFYILPWVITWLPVDNKFRHSSVWTPGPFTRPSALVSHTSRHEGIISDAFLYRVF